jgi:membrane associated rhomboid family serine protease/Tfp pilus assembly protein PilF
MLPVYRLPIVTYVLIAVNVLLWVAAAAIGPQSWIEQLWSPDESALMLLGAKYGPAIHAGQYWRLVTAMFLHAGWLHMAINMWALLQLGTLCEVLYGRARFLILYVCSGVMGSFASYALAPGLGVGASGAIFGLLGVAVVYSTKYQRDLPPGMGERLRRSLMPVLLINLAITFLVPMVDKWAHLGGLITGGLLAMLAEPQNAPPERREHEALPAPLALLTSLALLGYGLWGLGSIRPFAAPLFRASAAARRGDTETAIHNLRQAILRQPNAPGAREWLMTLLEREKRYPELTREFLDLSRTSLPQGELLAEGIHLADTLANAHQGAEAEAVYRRLMELDPDNSLVLNGLAYLYADVLETHLDEAEKLAQKALNRIPRGGDGPSWLPGASRLKEYRGAVLDTLAWVYFKEGKLAEAYSTQQEAVRLAGDNPEIRYHMGRIQEGRGQLPAARSEYGFALREDPKYAPARLALERLRRRE